MVNTLSYAIGSNIAVEQFNWELIAKKAKTERDLAFLKKREQELSTPSIQIYSSMDKKRREKLEKLQRIIASKEGYLSILRDAIANH